MKGIDAHCHLTHMDDADKIIEDEKEKIRAVINITTDIGEVESGLSLREKNPDFVFASMGLHPEGVEKYSDRQVEEFLELVKSSRKDIVAIGEVGIDYFYVKEKGKQKRCEEIFIQFIELANQLKKPLQIHSRNSEEKKTAISDVLKILTDNNARRVMMHSFSGSDDEMAYAIEQGYFISISTIIGRSSKHRRLVKAVPLDKLILETDSPWLHPYERSATNVPSNIHESAKIIGGILELSKEEILGKTQQNAAGLFKLDV